MVSLLFDLDIALAFTAEPISIGLKVCELTKRSPLAVRYHTSDVIRRQVSECYGYFV
ncbi:MAG: hypothetical protein JJT94_06800 [Bernardetiaceae bacterium]|nr:hypothetical protein [Bernardetiaceae bacterium]